MRKIYTLIAIVLLFSISEANAQRRNQRGRNTRKSSSLLKGEIGGNIGVSNFQGDFTQDGPGDGRIVVNGISVNATYSLHFMQRRRSINKSILSRLILKTNFGYTSGSFDNLGLSTGDESLNTASPIASNVLLGRLTSKTSVISLGTQLEYYFTDMFNYLHRSSSRGRYRGRSRNNNKRGAMYFGLGFGINSVTSEFDYNVPSNNGLPDNYTPQVLEGINSIVLSGNFAIGYRYKLNKEIDLVGELKTNYYFSDRVDAVDTTPDTGTATGIANEFNDYNSVLSIGAIYHLF